MVALASQLARGFVLLSALGMAACSSLGGLSPSNLIAGGKDKAAEQAAVQEFAVVAVCPQVQVRDGTQDLPIFEKGGTGDPTKIRFQATISKFARECHTDPTTGVTTIKVGVAGRLLAGPSGATGDASLPLRIVMVRDGSEVLYSQLIPVMGTVAPGTAAADWSKVVEGLTVPKDKSTGNFVIYVGFDDSTSTAGGKRK